MKQLLNTALVLASLLSAQAALAQSANQIFPAQGANGTAPAEEASQPIATAPLETAAPAPEPIVISWDRVGGKEKWWV